jgi:hypothetical protein
MSDGSCWKMLMKKNNEKFVDWHSPAWRKNTDPVNHLQMCLDQSTSFETLIQGRFRSLSFGCFIYRNSSVFSWSEQCHSVMLFTDRGMIMSSNAPYQWTFIQRADTWWRWWWWQTLRQYQYFHVHIHICLVNLFHTTMQAWVLMDKTDDCHCLPTGKLLAGSSSSFWLRGWVIHTIYSYNVLYSFT